MTNNHSSLILLTLLLILTLPGLISCQSPPPDSLEFGISHLNLPPNTERILEVYGVWEKKNGVERKLIVNDPDKPAELLFHSDNVPAFTIEGDGILHISDMVSSGDSATLGVRYQEKETYITVMIRPDLDSTIDADAVVVDPDAIDVLVNKQRSLPDYIPADLVRVAVPTVLSFDEVNHLRKPAALALAKMFATAQTEAGLKFYARSGYRSFATQTSLYNGAIDRDGQELADKYSARPGHSEHQTGLAMDITARSVNYQLSEDFESTPEGQWAAANAHRFGFILRYQKGMEDVTGYAFEPWHFRYIGEVAASEIYSRGLTLEEFFYLPEVE